MTARRYLVTGGSGFIGSALVRRLLSDGHTVRVLDNNSRGALRRLSGVEQDVEFLNADIRDAAAVRRAAQGIDSIVHLAYVNGTELFYSQPEFVLDVAVRGMLSVLDACREESVGELLLASSSEVYQTPPHVPTAEDVPLSVPDVLNPRYSYGGGKIACELMAINYGRTGFDRVMIVRPHNVYGPDMGWEHVLPQFILRAHDAIAAHPTGDVPFPIQGDGTQRRAFTHIDDFTDALLHVLHSGEHLEIYHAGNPDEMSIRDVVGEVFGHLGRTPTIIAGPAPAGATPRRCPDITKLSLLGFKPSISLRDGLPDMVDWYLSNLNLRPAMTAHQA
ncbi:MAG: NAD(P)-dependent oxidoreductase [Gemmatimonadaceae bacterium]